MKGEETPKFSGAHRRWGRPFGQLSTFHCTLSVIIVVIAFALFLIVLFLMKPAP